MLCVKLRYVKAHYVKAHYVKMHYVKMRTYGTRQCEHLISDAITERWTHTSNG